jgi:predicted O-linked N-acetylglucosamine transferase (SPINDLY family)
MLNWNSDVLLDLYNNNYANVVSFYENLSEANPDDHSIFLHLGLAYLLEENEEAAQTTWLLVIAGADEDEIPLWTCELLRILKGEASRQRQKKNLHKCLLILQNLRELEANNIKTYFELIEVEIQLQQFVPENYLQEVCTLLHEKNLDIDRQQLCIALRSILFFPSPDSLAFAEACLLRLDPLEMGLKVLIEVAASLGYYHNMPLFSIQLAELCLHYKPGYLRALENLPRLYLLVQDYPRAISAAQDFYECCTSLDLKFFSNSLLLKALLSAGAWSDLKLIAVRQKELLKALLDSHNINLSLPIIKSLVVFTGFLFYLEDNIQENRCLQNQASQLFLDNLRNNSQVKFPICERVPTSKKDKLKIGYISHTLKSHSVGWLSRWLFKYHNREEFDLSIYLLAQSSEDPFFRSWFSGHVDHVHSFLDDVPAAAEKIYNDEIDILIDLDSTTLDDTLTVMSLKPAPLQVTWLGWDASGLSTIDYFIADPYVLSSDADIHYQEKIWRLPHTYIAIDGFESDVPTLRRNDLNIPCDSIVYLSSQVGMKRHPEIIKMQFNILKEVPNSYFLIKGLSDDATIQEVFIEYADQAGVNPDRLRFLPLMQTEYIHRANLRLADIVLDTYPYNGATTTLETLWMGIPLVTRVGQQFAARNSYAFLMNVGVTEGISWTDEEYVEWGIRLGQDEQLRQQVTWKLKQSRQTSPLWNAKQFTREMENAYREMWSVHVAKHS